MVFPLLPNTKSIGTTTMQNETSTGSTTMEILEKQLNAPPPDLRALRADLPPDLTSLITNALAKDPEDRPHDIELVLWQLRAARRRLGVGEITGKHIRLPTQR